MLRKKMLEIQHTDFNHHCKDFKEKEWDACEFLDAGAFSWSPPSLNVSSSQAQSCYVVYVSETHVIGKNWSQYCIFDAFSFSTHPNQPNTHMHFDAIWKQKFNFFFQKNKIK